MNDPLQPRPVSKVRELTGFVSGLPACAIQRALLERLLAIERRLVRAWLSIAESLK
jgi:hypothetical protein